MTLAAGTKLGPYEIQSPLGAGGMGEVYRARDTRLERTVAIKILPAHLSANPEAKQRFEREAKAISSLSHPNICHLYDVGAQDGVDYLVMEYLEGETLADRLKKGALPLDQLLRCGMEIAEGLDKAHRSGVVHRDLKPGNIMLVKTGAKLMDFGLAKAGAVSTVSQPAEGLTQSLSPSLGNPAAPLTAHGTVVGTFQYMSPEQVEGKEADARSDNFALGAVLYEMATGKRAFEGKSAASAMAAVLDRDPALISSVQPTSPPALDLVVKTCLAKDPDQRFQSAHDVALQLRWLAQSSLTAVPAAPLVGRKKERSPLAWGLAALSLLAAISIGALHFAGLKAPRVLRAQLLPPEKATFNFIADAAGPPVISPDGSHIVFSAGGEGKPQLYLRALDAVAAQPLLGTSGAIFPFWSPDSRSVGFFQDGKMKRIDIAGGPPLAICEAPRPRGGSWGSSGIIVFEPDNGGGIFQVPASGGTPSQVTKPDSVEYTSHRWPWFLPDGKHFLYLAVNHNAPVAAETAIFLASLDLKESRLLVRTLSQAVYASGYLLFLRQNTLIAQPFDASRGELKGEPIGLIDGVQYDGGVWHGMFTVSENNMLLYQTGTAGSAVRLNWFDRTGKKLGTVGDPDDYKMVGISPDEKSLALDIGNPLGALWTYDLSRNVKTRLTFTTAVGVDAAWSPDGRQIAYTSAVRLANRYAIYVKSSNGAGEEKRLLEAPKDTAQAVCDWSPDGGYLMYTVGTSGIGNGHDLWVLPMTGERKPFAYLQTRADEDVAQFSPDGRWIAYRSDESGRPEIYVAPFPWTGAKWEISTGGGDWPRWRHDGKEIFFVPSGGNLLMSAEVDGSGREFHVGATHGLFRLSMTGSPGSYSVSHDGQRILVLSLTEDSSQPLTLLENWSLELKKK